MTAPPSTETLRHTATPWVADDGDGQYFIIACEETGEAVAVLVDPISVGGHDILLPRDENFVKAARGEGQFKLVYSRYAEHKANAAFIVTAVNSYASLTAELAEWKQAASVEAGLRREFAARVAELEAALREISSWKDDTLGARPKEPHPYNCAPEITEAFDRGARMAFYRCAERARATLDNADGGRG